MDLLTTEQWDEVLWDSVKDIYNEAFGEGKPERIIRNMFEKHLCSLHVAMLGDAAVAVALTGSIKGSRILLIDYLAVRIDFRGLGTGKDFVKKIKEWAVLEAEYDYILLEAECEKTPENLSRIFFWEKCGFKLNDDYIHHYIWVPEPYMAMTLRLHNDSKIPDSGKTLFKYIEKFHKKCFQQK